MTAVIVLAVIAAVLTGLALLRVGCTARYSAEGFSLWLRVGALRIRLIPAKAKKPKQEKKTRKPKQKKETKKPAEEKKPGLLSQLRPMLAPAWQTLGKLRRKLRIDRLELIYTIAGKDDPAGAAMQYGIICAGGGTLWPTIDRFFHVKTWDTDITVDFESSETVLYFQATASYRLGQLLAIAAAFFIQWIKINNKNQIQKQNQEQPIRRSSNGRKASHQ